MKEYKFTATIEAGRGGGAFVKVPIDVQKEFGTRGRVRVKAMFENEPYKGSIASMGGGVYILGVLKEIRRKIGKGIGDRIRVIMVKDESRRTVSIPRELKTALSRNNTARIAFAKLSYTHRKEYAQWVAEAKKEETRQRRAVKAVSEILKKLNS